MLKISPPWYVFITYLSLAFVHVLNLCCEEDFIYVVIMNLL